MRLPSCAGDGFAGAPRKILAARASCAAVDLSGEMDAFV
jgi:hypothetical protein